MCNEQTTQPYISLLDLTCHPATFRILTGSNDDDFLLETSFHLLRVAADAAFSVLGFGHMRVLSYCCKVGHFQVANNYSQTVVERVVS